MCGNGQKLEARNMDMMVSGEYDRIDPIEHYSIKMIPTVLSR